MYQYHHKEVEVMGNLTVVNPAHMGLTDINHWKYGEKNVVDSDYTVATGLHLHLGDVIHLMRGGTALNILSPAITHASSRGCPPGTYMDHTMGVLTCRDVHGTRELHPRIMINQWQRAW
jgi:hypothetical protein